MTESERAHLRDRLLDERLKIARESQAFAEAAVLTQQESSGDLSNHPLHMADLGSDELEAEMAHTRASFRTRLFAHIDDALIRLYEDPSHFGRCIECRAEIPFVRLDLVPWTMLCASCEGRKERVNELAAPAHGPV